MNGQNVAKRFGLAELRAVRSSSIGLNDLICVIQLVCADLTVPFDPPTSPIIPCQAPLCQHHTFNSLIAINQVQRRQIRQMEDHNPFNHSKSNL